MAGLLGNSNMNRGAMVDLLGTSVDRGEMHGWFFKKH